MVINCAFIGFGKSTTRYHLPYVLHRKDSWHVAHIFRRHAKPEEQAPIYSHIHFTSDLDEVLNDPDVKLVVVCTHADSHFEYAKRALEAGKNVLVEKPFTPTLAQAKELFALAKSKGLTVTPYQNRRFDSCFLTAKKAIESGKLGEIVEVESHFDYYRPVAETKPGLPPDGAFYGLGVHTMDQIISLFGRPDHVTYDIRRADMALVYGLGFPPFHGGEDTFRQCAVPQLNAIDGVRVHQSFQLTVPLLEQQQDTDHFQATAR